MRRSATGSPTSTTPISARHCRGPAPVPHDGPRLPAHHRGRGGAQILEQTGALPDAVAACVGGGSNAIGIFHAFVPDEGVACTASRPVARRRHRRHAATITAGRSASFTARAPTSCRTTTARPWTRLDLRRTRLSGRRSRTFLAARERPGHLPCVTDARRWTPSAAVPHRGHHPGHRVRARPRRSVEIRLGRWNSARARRSWSASRAEATRTWTPRPVVRLSSDARTR